MNRFKILLLLLFCIIADVGALAQTGSHDPLAKLEDPNEVSMFLEAKDKATFYIWAYSTVNGHDNGNYYANNAGWPGQAMSLVGQLSNGNYLYKWTKNATLEGTPNALIISRKGSTNNDKIYSDKPFYNHGYYIYDAVNNTVTADGVVSPNDGSSTSTGTSTYGKRVIYELNVGSFTQEGTFAAAQNRLQYLKDLGVDVIWLMPVFPRGTANADGASPYAVADYTTTNASYGTKDQLKAFVEAAHKLNMDVWLDWVPNHAATNNIWLNKDGGDYHPEYFKGYNATDPDDKSKFVNPTSGNVTYGDVYQLDYTSTNGLVDRMTNIMKDWVTSTGIDGFRLDYVSSMAIPNSAWEAITNGVKNVKDSATVQFLAEADFSNINRDPDHDGISATNFQYDYAWELNDALRKFGTSPNAGTEAADDGDLTHIINTFIGKTAGLPIDRMVYLNNHDINRDQAPYTMQGIWGDNRYAMTALEFTLPGMPLVYNGQELSGDTKLDYFKDTKIDWTKTDDNMSKLITAMSKLKHTNPAVSDGNSYYMRGKTALLKVKSDNNGVFAMERTNGTNNGMNHVMLVMNLSDQPQTNVTIYGATLGTWTRYLSGTPNDVNVVTTPKNDDIANIDEAGFTVNATLPAHSYYVLVSTSKSNNYTEGYYIEMNDSWNTQKHQMKTLNSDANYDYYQFVINANSYDDLSTEPGSTPAEDGKIYFKFRHYTPYLNNVLKDEAYFGAKTGEGTFTKDGTLTYDFTTENTAGANGRFSIAKTPGVQQYKITLAVSKTDGTVGNVSVEYVTNIEEGWFLITPKNIGAEDEETPSDRTWPMLDEISSDPSALSDLENKFDRDKVNLHTYTINAADFDNYMPENLKGAQSIEFRIRPYGKDEKGVIKGNTGYVSPQGAGENDYSAKNYSFTFTKDNNYYANAWWPNRTQNKDAWFIIRKEPDVAKYIIQTWQTTTESTGETRVRVSYVKTYNYAGSKLEDVEDGKDVYLYNVDLQRFLYIGNKWGTMASLLYPDLGLQLKITPGEITENPNFVHITSTLNNFGKDLGIDESYRQESKKHPEWMYDYDIFCDRDNGSRYIFEKADNIDYANTYYIKLQLKYDGKYRYVFADPDNKTQVKFKAIDTEAQADSIKAIKGSRWQIITRADLIKKLRDENADLYGGTSADATFLMKNQGFSRMADPSTEKWDTSTGIRYTQDGCRNAGEEQYGMYYNARIEGAGQMYQEVAVPVWGLYRMNAYGFYSGNATNMYYQYQKADGSWSNPTFQGTALVNDNTKKYDASKDATPENIDVETGREFYNESVLGADNKYLNTLFINIPQDGYKDANNNYHLRIGFNKTGTPIPTDQNEAANYKSDDYTAVDDVHLHYIGKSPFLLDEDSIKATTGKDYIDAEEHNDMSVYLKRNFKVDTWNTLVLPVNLSLSTLNAIFGDRVEVAEPYGLDDDDPDCIKFTPVDLTPGSIPIQAGRFYIVKPSKLINSTTFVSVDETTHEVTNYNSGDNAKFYDLGRHNMNEAKSTIPSEVMGAVYKSANDTTGHNYIKFVGSYFATTVPAQSYVFASDDKMHKTAKDRPMGGFRFYVIDTDAQGNNIYKKSAAKSSKMANLADDYLAMLRNGDDYGTPTAITKFKVDDRKATNTDKYIYDLSGRRVGKIGDQRSLTNGVYILNGKKFIKQ